MKAVTSEIFNHVSHNDVNVTIYTKDVYIQDKTLNFVNMSSVMITSHPDLSEDNKQATIIATEFEQFGISQKARFHVLTNTNFLFNDIINSREFTESEKGVIASEKDNYILRTGITLENVNIYREEIDYNKEFVFIYALYLQTKTASFSKFRENLNST